MIECSDTTTVTPIYLVATVYHEGLLTREHIEESNEILMYYEMLANLSDRLAPYAGIRDLHLNIILNDYETFEEERYFIALKVLGDIMKRCRKIKLHIFDEPNAERRELI